MTKLTIPGLVFFLVSFVSGLQILHSQTELGKEFTAEYSVRIQAVYGGFLDQELRLVLTVAEDERSKSSLIVHRFLYDEDGNSIDRTQLIIPETEPDSLPQLAYQLFGKSPLPKTPEYLDVIKGGATSPLFNGDLFHDVKNELFVLSTRKAEEKKRLTIKGIGEIECAVERGSVFSEKQTEEGIGHPGQYYVVLHKSTAAPFGVAKMQLFDDTDGLFGVTIALKSLSSSIEMYQRNKAEKKRVPLRPKDTDTCEAEVFINEGDEGRELEFRIPSGYKSTDTSSIEWQVEHITKLPANRIASEVHSSLRIQVPHDSLQRPDDLRTIYSKRKFDRGEDPTKFRFKTSSCGLDRYVVSVRFNSGKKVVQKSIQFQSRKRIYYLTLGREELVEKLQINLQLVRHALSNEFGIELQQVSGDNSAANTIEILCLENAFDDRDADELEGLIRFDTGIISEVQQKYESEWNDFSRLRLKNSSYSIQQFVDQSRFLRGDLDRRAFFQWFLGERMRNPNLAIELAEMYALNALYHEIGHSLGLVPKSAKAAGTSVSNWSDGDPKSGPHCRDPNCVMHAGESLYRFARKSQRGPLRFDGYDGTPASIRKCALFLLYHNPLDITGGTQQDQD